MLVNGKDQPIDWCVEIRRLLAEARRANLMLPKCFTRVTPSQQQLIVDHALKCRECRLLVAASQVQELISAFLWEQIQEERFRQDFP